MTYTVRILRRGMRNRFHDKVWHPYVQIVNEIRPNSDPTLSVRIICELWKTKDNKRSPIPIFNDIEMLRWAERYGHSIWTIVSQEAVVIRARVENTHRINQRSTVSHSTAICQPRLTFMEEWSSLPRPTSLLRSLDLASAEVHTREMHMLEDVALFPFPLWE